MPRATWARCAVNRCDWIFSRPLTYTCSNKCSSRSISVFFFFQAEDGIRDSSVTGVQTCALPIYHALLGPGAASMAEFQVERHLVTMSPSRWLAVFIATGIGLHNFAEGLAIGQSAAAGELSLALALIVGFGLHNATEGFGIVAPLTGDKDRPSWAFL